ncbi:RNA-dependent RNA polymerase [La Gloria virus]|uniref:RNA-directed RNA polymerase L n=6 Tax=La Gloria virus TaxID=2559110 RepID=A0A482KD21_9VIRU|nr:RNA-dependent RNA polymerase [La Gloria virus]QBQ01748.1 RNA-dependent RNA polymerase [La Gloria virus]
MDEIIKKQIPLSDGFNKWKLNSYVDSLYAYELPEFDLTKMGSSLRVELNFSNADPNSTIGSTLISSPDILIPSKELPNMVHNLTVGHLSEATDRMFSSVFEIKQDGFDGHSPDMIIETASGSYYVIEFTTFRGGENGAMKAALNKIGKYEIACANRSHGRKLLLAVIAVHRQGVISNLMLNDEEVNELVYRYKLSLSIFREAMKLCPELTDDDSELTKTEREVLGILSMIDVDWSVTESSFPYFKKRMFDQFRGLIPDENYMTEIISKEMQNAQEAMIKSSFSESGRTLDERLSMNLSECDSFLSEFTSNYNRLDHARDIYDSKSTVQIPSWFTREGPKGKDLNPLKEFSVAGDHPMCGIWSKVCLSAQCDEILRMDDSFEDELFFALNGGMERPDERNKYHRVKLELNREESDYIATLGVNGKKHKDSPSSQEARKRSKLCFRTDHDVSRIEGFLNDHRSFMFATNNDLYCPLDEDYDLRIAAQSIHQPTLTANQGANEFLTNHSNFLHSPLGSWTQMVSLIGAELSASVKQHVKPGFFIVKRLKDSQIYLLIKPTLSTSHIFVSLAVSKFHLEGCLWGDGVFKQPIDAGDLLVTDFISYKMSKLTNLCKCCSLIESALAFWTEAYGFLAWESTKTASQDRSGSAQEVRYMTKMSLLTLLEDKSATEELQTIMRYIVMEGFVSQPELPKPQKMVSKIPTILRTELQVLLFNRVISSMRRIAERPFALNKKGGQISWSFLFNPLSGSPLKDLQPLISACYNGYFKNKEEETEPSVLSKMYKKIIELEHLCPESDRYLGYEDPRDPSMHEFSVSYLKSCTEHAKQLLKKTHGQSVMAEIDSQITREISSITLERLATLKATSNFDENWYIYKDVKDKNYTRDKLLVRMSSYASDGKTLAIQMFDECMKKIEERSAMHICLFKKMQHAGLREIYVMGAEERIVQCIVEAIARTIGSFFPSDTLCNPSNKTKIPESHGVRARKHCKGPVWTCATSDDARKWNQGHFVTKFSLMLCEFTHPRWWPVIIRGCSMFTNKYMMMNLNYLKILDGHKELNVEDPFVKDLFEAYHGERQQPWIAEGQTFLRTKTGMMQGILHFTSSLLHTIHQEYIRSLTFKIMNMKVHPEASFKIVCDMMQGSDDSSMIISFPSSDPQILARYKVAAALCFRMKKRLGVYLAIYPSEKSTSNTDFVMEYNSEFYFHSQHVRPTIRWISACCSLPEVETLVARQEEAANLMTSVSEGGGSFSLSAQIQQCQCTLHYMLMGMGVSSLFGEYKKAILKWKDPGLGFFLLDNPYAAGLGGFRFNLYKAITRTSLQKLYAFFMKKVRGGEDRDDDLDNPLVPETCSVSPGGALILSSSLKWGSRQKFKKLRDRLNIPDNWVDLINENPEVLYRAPRSGHEIMLRIAEKVHSPGVVSSLSSGNAVAKVMASSVYFLSANIFEDSGRPEFSFMENSKYSLLQKMAAYEGFSGSDDMTDEDLLFLFPNIEELNQLDIVVFNRGEINIARRANLKEATQTRVVVFEEHRALRVSPEKLVSDKWFGTQKSKIGRTMFELEWDRLKSIISWLGDDPASTLVQSPLHSHVQIRNFFARIEGKSRVVRVTGAPVKKRSGVSKLAMVVRDNFCKVGHIKDIEDITGLERSQNAELLKHLLFGILQGPYSSEAKEDMCQKVLFRTPLLEIKESDGKTKTNIIGILQRFVGNDTSIVDLIKEVGAGTIGGFLKAQESKVVDGKVNYYGYGTWRGVMDGSQVQIEIYNKIGMPPTLQMITVSGRTSPWHICQSVRAWCEDIGAKNNVDVSSKHSFKTVKFWLYDYKLYGSDKPYGCPVYLISERMTDLVNITSDRISMKIRRSTINLYIKESRSDMHVLSYTASDNDISPISVRSTNRTVREIMSMFSKDPSSSWMKCESLHSVFIGKILDLSEGKIKRDHIDPERLQHIIKTCTESSLRSRVGTVYSGIPKVIESNQIMDYDSIIELMIEDFSADGFEFAVQELAADLEEEYDNEEFDMSDIDLFGPAHYKEISDLAMVSHPLMDEFVDNIVHKVGRKEIRRALENYVCTTRSRPYLINLFRALKRDPLSLRASDNDSEEGSEPDDDMIG